MSNEYLKYFSLKTLINRRKIDLVDIVLPVTFLQIGTILFVSKQRYNNDNNGATNWLKCLMRGE